MSGYSPYNQGSGLRSATRQDFPCLYHFWPCYQREIGREYLEDIANGILLHRNSAWLNNDGAGPQIVSNGKIRNPSDAFSLTNGLFTGINDGFSVYPAHPSNEGLDSTSGNIICPGNKPFIFFAVGKFNSGGVGLGNQAILWAGSCYNVDPSALQPFRSIGLWPDMSQSILDNIGGTYPKNPDNGGISSPGTFGNTPAMYTQSNLTYTRALIVSDYRAVDGAKMVEGQVGNTQSILATAPVGYDNIQFPNSSFYLDQKWGPYIGTACLPQSTPDGALSKGWASGRQITNLYGMALFIFQNSIPSDYLTALQWMGVNWSTNDPSTNRNSKTIWPGWAGLT